VEVKRSAVKRGVAGVVEGEEKEAASFCAERVMRATECKVRNGKKPHLPNFRAL